MRVTRRGDHEKANRFQVSSWSILSESYFEFQWSTFDKRNIYHSPSGSLVTRVDVIMTELCLFVDGKKNDCMYWTFNVAAHSTTTPATPLRSVLAAYTVGLIQCFYHWYSPSPRHKKEGARGEHVVPSHLPAKYLVATGRVATKTVITLSHCARRQRFAETSTI